MKICQLLSPETTFVCDEVTSKKKVLEKVSQIVADKCSISSKCVFESLVCREKLGTTALGNGVAIPHGRISECQQAISVFLLLETPIDYDAPDKQSVDIIFAILVPEEAHNDHLRHLAEVAEILSQQKLLTKLRHAHCGEALYDILEDAANSLPK